MRYLIAVILLAGLGLSACGDGKDVNSPVNNSANATGAQGAGSPTASPVIPGNPNDTRTPTPGDGVETDTADFEGTAGKTEKKHPSIAEVAVMSDVRSARHGNYDRLVFEFLGPDLPGYRIEYIDKPVRACGSGHAVPLTGDGRLEISFSPAQANAPGGDSTIKDRDRSPNHPVVKDLKQICNFEAEVAWVAGVSSPNRYRVIELKDPTRLVVDIKH